MSNTIITIFTKGGAMVAMIEGSDSVWVDSLSSGFIAMIKEREH